MRRTGSASRRPVCSRVKKATIVASSLSHQSAAAQHLEAALDTAAASIRGSESGRRSGGEARHGKHFGEFLLHLAFLSTFQKTKETTGENPVVRQFYASWRNPATVCRRFQGLPTMRGVPAVLARCAAYEPDHALRPMEHERSPAARYLGLYTQPRQHQGCSKQHKMPQSPGDIGLTRAWLVPGIRQGPRLPRRRSRPAPAAS
jgi:hypothetical protein